VGLGDASQTTFPIPVVAPTSVTVFVNGVPQESSAYTVHSAANLMNDDKYASPVSADDFSSVNATDASSAGVSRDGLSCLKVTPAGTGTDVRSFSNHAGAGAVSVGSDYTAVVSVLESKSAPRDFKVLIRWIDAGLTFISNSEGSAVTATTGEWLVYSYTATAPASAAFAAAGIWETNDDADPFYLDCFAVCPGDYTRWHLPSQSPGLVEFATAPAAGARITATATGCRVSRCRFEPGSSWRVSSAGHAAARSIRAVEVIEV